jgi:hypothetical protein
LFVFFFITEIWQKLEVQRENLPEARSHPAGALVGDNVSNFIRFVKGKNLGATKWLTINCAMKNYIYKLPQIFVFGGLNEAGDALADMYTAKWYPIHKSLFLFHLANTFLVCCLKIKFLFVLFCYFDDAAERAGNAILG